MSIPPACQKIADELKALHDEQASLAEDMKDAAPGQKSAITMQIKKLTPKITEKKNLLDACIAKNTPPPKTNPCLGFESEVQALVVALQKEVRDAVKDLQEDLKTAAPGQKPAIIKAIKQAAADAKAQSALTPQIQAKQKQYYKCLQVADLKPPLSTTFTGKSTLTTTDPDAHGPYTNNVNIGLYFKEGVSNFVSVTIFPPISVSFDVGPPVGLVTTTVSLNGDATGTFEAATGSIKLTVPLLFHHSTIWAGDSTLVITLTSTKLMDAGGNLTVSGSATFKEGYLDGETCSLTVAGVISPQP